MKTKKAALGAALVLAAVAAASPLSAAPKKATLPAPTCMGAFNDGTQIEVEWTPVTTAASYSVEFIATYNDNGNIFTTDVDYNATTTFLIVQDSDFTIAGSCGDISTCPLNPAPLVVHVKALNPPVKGGAQSNPFTGLVTVVDDGGAPTGGITGSCN